jgi:hypothetical protein
VLLSCWFAPNKRVLDIAFDAKAPDRLSDRLGI